MPWTTWRESSVARGVPFGAPRRRGGRQSSRPQPGAGAGADLDSEVRGREGAGSCSESLCPPDGASAPAEPLCSSLAPSPASQDQDDGRGIHRPAGRWPEPSAWVHGASEPAGPALCPTPGRGRRSATPGGRLFLPGRARCPVLGVGPLMEGGGFLAWLQSPLWPRDGWIASWARCFLKPAWQGEASGRQGFCGAGVGRASKRCDLGWGVGAGCVPCGALSLRSLLLPPFFPQALSLGTPCAGPV